MNREVSSQDVIYGACVSILMCPEYSVKFQDPEFYEPDNTVAVIKYEKHEAFIAVRGEARALHQDGTEISKFSEYRELFSDGDLSALEEWAVLTKSWFQIAFINDGEYRDLSSYENVNNERLNLTQCLNKVKGYFLNEVLG